MKRSARRYPANEMDCSTSGQGDHARHGDVVIQVPGLLVFQRDGVEDVDLEAGAVQVELLAIGGHAEAEAVAAGHFLGFGDAVRAEIEGPEFAAPVAEVSVGDH